MGELGLNKVFGSLIAAALVVMGLQTISNIAFSSGGHHGHHGEKLAFCESVKNDNAYYVDVPCGGSTVVDEGPAYDLGALLAKADASKGERVFKSVCSSCHTVNQGGANGTGPNLYGLIDKDIASVGGFGYSSALSGVEGNWDYVTLDRWIDDPKNIARGVNMVANVKKDPDRANLIAYLAANTPGASAFPAPLPEEGAVVESAGDISEILAPETEGGETMVPAGEVTEVPGTVTDAGASGVEVTVDGVSVPTTDASEETLDGVLDEMEEIVDSMEERVDGLDNILEDAGEAGLPVDDE